MKMQSVVLVVHPVDTTEHPTYPPGYRWAVMVGTTDPVALEYCVGAGHSADCQEAALVGETVQAAVSIALGLSGISSHAAAINLDHDPIPGTADQAGNRIFSAERRSNVI